MSNAIVKQFENIVKKALSHYSEKNEVAVEEVGISISLDNEEELVYTLLKAEKDGQRIKGYNKIEELEFVKGILLRKFDLTGLSVIVPAFIKQIVTSLCAAHECSKQDIVVNLFAVNGKIAMYLYINKKFVEVLDLKTLLE